MAVTEKQLKEGKPEGAPLSTGPGTGKRVLRVLSDNAILAALIAIVLLIAAYDMWKGEGTFLSLSTLRNVLIHNSTRVIVAMGAAFAILTAGADLSAGRMVGIAAVLSASMLQAPDYLRLFYPNLPQLPLFLPILAAIAACAAFGFINGWVIAQFGVAPFIATLGSYAAIYGINSKYFNMEPNSSQPIGGLRADFTGLGTGAIGSGLFSLPYIVLIAAAVAVFMWVLMNKTPFGKNVYAIGGNVNAAKVSGINVYWTIIIMYSIAGSLYGLAGVLEAGRTGGATNNYGNMYELDAIASCVVGGVSVTGGIGTIPGIVVGVLIFGVINYGLTFINVDPYWQQIIKGVIIVAAVSFDVRKYVAKK
ncbi:MAG TPA: galactose/methyl galactoside ABC transporter permease MglC [Anaeromyxobacter sp.]|nr:galactose/methyl galactoside ABC transporter permease MglC [Anaeromyxobacter sp.]HVO19109.1 galactose/methyl galactoside ABC transporter permease MglC [Anaeromyxobacter sp.]